MYPIMEFVFFKRTWTCHISMESALKNTFKKQDFTLVWSTHHDFFQETHIFVGCGCCCCSALSLAFAALARDRRLVLGLVHGRKYSKMLSISIDNV